MLRKLFKYDFLAIGKTMWLFTILAVVAGIIASCIGIFMNNFYTESIPDYFQVSLGIMFVFLLIFCLYAILAYLVLAIIMILMRYYKNFFTDEGYLTFTLPVKTSTLLDAKILSGILWVFISLTVFFLCILSFILFMGFDGNIKEMIESFDFYAIPGFSYSSIFFDYYDMDPLISGILATVSGLLRIVYFVFVMYFSVTFASVVVKRARMVLGIVCFMGINSVTSVGIFIISLLLYTFLVDSDAPLMNPEHFTYLRYGIEYAVYGGLAVGAYFLNRYLLKNKLNLV